MILALLACGGENPEITKLFEEHKAQAEARATKVPAEWKPEVVIRVSDPMLSELVDAAMGKAAAGAGTMDLGIAKVKSDLGLKNLRLGKAEGCSDCVAITTAFEGVADTTVAGSTSRIPFDGKFSSVLHFATEGNGESRSLTVRMEDVKDLEMSFGKANAGIDLGPLLQRWGKSVLEDIPAVPLGDIGGEDLPIRDLRVLADGKGVRVEILTDADIQAGIAKLPAAPSTGWSMLVDQRTLAAMARRAAFEEGELDLGLQPEPLTLSLNGSGFKMGMRLWRVSAGWWRDYEINGKFTLNGNKLLFSADDVKETAASEGADTSDLLSTLARPLLIQGIQDAATAAVPTLVREREQGIAVVLKVDTVKGSDGLLQVSGGSEVSGAPKRAGTTPAKNEENEGSKEAKAKESSSPPPKSTKPATKSATKQGSKKK